MQLHELLKKARKDKGISVYKLARLTGLSEITISNIEKNRTSGNIDSVTKLINALGIDLLITKDGDFKATE